MNECKFCCLKEKILSDKSSNMEGEIKLHAIHFLSIQKVDDKDMELVFLANNCPYCGRTINPKKIKKEKKIFEECIK